MAYPTIADSTKGSTTTAGSSHSIGFPGGTVSNGQLILIVFAHAQAVTANALTGWTELVDDGVANGLAVLYRTCDGTEGTGITLATSGSTKAAWTIYKFDGAATGFRRLPGSDVFAHLFRAHARALRASITLTNVGNSAGWLQASYLFAGDYTELSYNPASVAIAWRDDTELQRSDGGTVRGEGLITYREAELTIPFLADAQRSTFMDMLRFAGKARPVFLGLYPGAGGEKEHDYTYLARLADMPDVATDGAHYNLHATRLQLTEI